LIRPSCPKESSLYGLRRECQCRTFPPPEGDGTLLKSKRVPSLTEVVKYRPHEDGYLQLELRRYVRRDGSARERGPY
jgi:hypothetical protein